MRCGLIGEKLGHSYSREIHEAIADYRYELWELRPEEVEPFLRKRDFNGINVTIPYKETVLPYLDVLSDEARRIGAVNTVVNRGGKLYGYNTDFFGMRALMEHAGIDPRGKKALVLGSGGTSKTARAVLRALGAAETVTVSRKARPDAVTYEQAIEFHKDAQIIVNATPVGMFPDEDASPLDLTPFARPEGVLDAIYHPLRTNLVQQAHSLGIPAEGGLYMLAAQAAQACSLFLDRDADLSLIERAYRKVLREKRSIVLIGMPSCGKTTVGRELARRLNLPFFDTDELILSRIGGTIADYISREGEPAFRAIERDVIGELSRQSGCVIATGGGAVLDRRNVQALRRNGVLVFLDRELRLLRPTADRPLSSDAEQLARLYRQRYPLYRKAADLRIDANGDPESVALIVEKELNP